MQAREWGLWAAGRTSGTSAAIFTGSFVGQRQLGAQRADVAFKHPGNRTELFERQISLAALDSADVTPINPR